MQRIISSIARPKLCSPFKLKYIINFLIVLCSEQINFACCQVLFDVGFQCVCALFPLSLGFFLGVKWEWCLQMWNGQSV